MQPLWALTQWWIATGILHTERNCFPSGHFTTRREGPFYTPAKLDVTPSFPHGPAAIIIDGLSCRGVCGFLFACHQFGATLCIIHQCCRLGCNTSILHNIHLSVFACDDDFCSMLIGIINTLDQSRHPVMPLCHPVPFVNTAFSPACCSSRWSMNVCGTGSASPRRSWEWWPSSGSGTRKSCWPKPWSPCRTRDMPTRRSWSSTETASTSRTSARISERRLVPGIPSHQELSRLRNISTLMRRRFLCWQLLCSSVPPTHI